MKKKLLVFMLATSTILSACNSKSANTSPSADEIYDYLSMQSSTSDFKTTKPKKATDTEVYYSIPAIKNLEESVEYKLNGRNKYLQLIEYGKENGKSEYFNEQEYNKAVQNKEDIYYATVENNLDGYFKIGLINYSTDKTFKDQSKLIAAYPYITINPRIKIKNVNEYNYNKDTRAFFNYSLSLDLSNLTDEEIKAINKQLNIESDKLEKEVLINNFLPLLNNDTAQE